MSKTELRTDESNSTQLKRLMEKKPEQEIMFIIRSKRKTHLKGNLIYFYQKLQ